MKVWRVMPWRINFSGETSGWDDVAVALNALLRSDAARSTEAVSRYEEAFANCVHRDGHAIAFGAGRMALWAILDAFGIGAGDDVVLPAFTCEVVPLALLYRGIRPVYADIDPLTYNLDPRALDRVWTPKTRAVIAQHTFGRPAAMAEIADMAKAKGAAVIEDCAIAFGSRYEGRPVGTLGDAAFYSTDRTKVFSTVLGGAAFTLDRGLADALWLRRDRASRAGVAATANVAVQQALGYVLDSPFVYGAGRYLSAALYRSGAYYDHHEDRRRLRRPRRYPRKLSNLQARIGLNQLGKIDAILEKRRATAERYVEILAANGVVIDGGSAFTSRFPVRLNERDAFIRRWRRHFEVGTWFDSPTVGWPRDESELGYEAGSCPVAEAVHRQVVNFPTHQRSSALQEYLFKIVGTLRPDDVATAIGAT